MNLTPISPEAARQKVPGAIARFERWLEARRIEALLADDDEEEPGFLRQAQEPAVGELVEPKAPRAMLAPTRSQVENGYITGQPTVKRTTKPGPKAEPKVSRRYRGAGQSKWKGPRK